jgi:hypothetical protein
VPPSVALQHRPTLQWWNHDPKAAALVAVADGQRPPLRPLPEHAPGDYWLVVPGLPDGDWRVLYYATPTATTPLAHAAALVTGGDDATPTATTPLAHAAALVVGGDDATPTTTAAAFPTSFHVVADAAVTRGT